MNIKPPSTWLSGQVHSSQPKLVMASDSFQGSERERGGVPRGSGCLNARIGAHMLKGVHDGVAGDHAGRHDGGGGLHI